MSRIEQIESELVAMFMAESAYGCGFYSDPSWLRSYKNLAEMIDVKKCPACSDWYKGECFKCKASAELEAARARVAQLEKQLKVKPEKPAAVIVANDFDETDAGNGVAESRKEVTISSFLDDLHEMRMRTAEKRRRLA